MDKYCDYALESCDYALDLVGNTVDCNAVKLYFRFNEFADVRIVFAWRGFVDADD